MDELLQKAFDNLQLARQDMATWFAAYSNHPSDDLEELLLEAMQHFRDRHQDFRTCEQLVTTTEDKEGH